MTALLIEIAPELYARLDAEARRRGTSAEGIVRGWLTAHLVTEPAEPTKASGAETTGDRGRAIAAMRAAGLLTAPGPEMKRRAARSRATLETVSAALSRPGGRPLSEIILEQRGPKE